MCCRTWATWPGPAPSWSAALRISEAALGPDHPTIGIWRGNLGNVLRDLGDLAGARTELRARRCGSARRRWARTTPPSASGGTTSAMCCRTWVTWPGPAPSSSAALQISEAALGPEHPTIGIWRNNLGNVLRDLGDLAGARTQLEAALRISEAALGPDHPTIGIWRGNLGSVLQDLGDLAGARTNWRRRCGSARRRWARTTPPSAFGGTTSAACCGTWVSWPGPAPNWRRRCGSVRRRWARTTPPSKPFGKTFKS